jgi:hypothetical protein
MWFLEKRLTLNERRKTPRQVSILVLQGEVETKFQVENSQLFSYVAFSPNTLPQ